MLFSEKSYEILVAYLKRYGCSAVSSKDEIDGNSYNFTILSKCGHESTTSFTKLRKHKRGIYCDDCLEKYIKNKTKIECMGIECNNMIVPTKEQFLFCCMTCSRQKPVSDEQKNKLRDATYKHLGYVDKNGNVLNDKTIAKINKERKIKRIRDS